MVAQCENGPRVSNQLGIPYGKAIIAVLYCKDLSCFYDVSQY